MLVPVHGFAFLVLSQAALVTVPPVPGQDEGCPAPREVSEAVRALLPKAYVTSRAPGADEALRLYVSASAIGGSLVTLTDHEGRTKLQRELPPPGATDECKALAQSVALMVDRYLQALAVPIDAREAARNHPWDAFASLAGGQAGFAGRSVDFSLGVGRALGAWRMQLAVGFGTGLAASYGAGGRTSGSRIPVVAEVGPHWAWGVGDFQPAVVGGADVLNLRARGVQDSRIWLAGPFIGASLAYRIGLGSRAFVRPSAGAMYAFYAYQFKEEGREASLETRRVQLRLALSGGFTF